MHWLELKVPPPVVALFLAVAIYLAAPVFPSLPLGENGRLILACIFAGIGISFDLAGLYGFHKAHTTINPLAPKKASVLVTTGIYRFTRNPMYIGLACLLMAWGCYWGSSAVVIDLPLFIAYITVFQIKPEERILREKFPKQFDGYCLQVRRWL
ncbi:methyltransferase family protein [Oceanospirillum maris]|jgi:protein-S-isoprenylcysteine O-methyltransferase Ste14|uniref:methyltransferase family protein n=1 Tax=Oceanospirillum maris TaxID=64977 RepID=UPI000418CD94|nr:isoprenylcysteine carboxylmethyltransferase family protein [Oceanospirillum maris]